MQSDDPRTPRDHEILALSNEFLTTSNGHDCAVVLAALAQAFLFILSSSSVLPLPPRIQLAAHLLTELTERILARPQPTLQ